MKVCSYNEPIRQLGARVLAAIAAERQRASGSKLRETRGRGRIAAGTGAQRMSGWSLESDGAALQ